MLAKPKRFKPIAAGKTRKVTLRLSKRKARLVRRKKGARKVDVRVRVRDQVGNVTSRKVKRKLKPRKRRKR